MVFLRWRSAEMLAVSILGLLTFNAHPSTAAAAAPTATELTVRVRMSDGSVKRVQAQARDTVEDVCERLGCEPEAGVAIEEDPEAAVEVSSTLKELSVGHGGWLYMLRCAKKTRTIPRFSFHPFSQWSAGVMSLAAPPCPARKTHGSTYRTICIPIVPSVYLLYHLCVPRPHPPRVATLSPGSCQQPELQPRASNTQRGKRRRTLLSDIFCGCHPVDAGW
ncbi:unnamed protein product [Ectocarpus sp. 8 AP-2014]